MMIAARLAGGNLFLPFWVGGFFGWGILGALGAARSTRIFLRGFFGWGFLGALGFFLRGCFGWGILFLGWWGVFWIESVGKN